LQSLCLELQLEESVDDLMQQLGADAKGHISYAQFILCHKNLQLTPSQALYEVPIDSMLSSAQSPGSEKSCNSVELAADKVFRRRDPKNGSGRLRNARHWDWLGQALEAGFLRGQPPDKGSAPTSKEQLLLERRQKLQGKIGMPQIQNDAEKEIGNEGGGLSDNSQNIAGLSQRLAQVTAERDQLRNQKDHDQDWESQCQRYEERMVELHSVIAELSRKLDIGKNDIIPEESEFEEVDENQSEKSYVTDSCLEEEQEDVGPYDENSLKFERDLDKHPEEDEVISYDDENKDVLYKIELFDELQNEVAETRTDNERLQQVICDRDDELAQSSEAIRSLHNERESLKRQLEDLQSTLEYQEAKMDRAGSGKSSSERRSLRRKKSSVGGRPPMSPTSPDPNSNKQAGDSISDRSIDRNNHKSREMELQLAKATSHIDHLRSQNDVLELTMEDAKNTNEKLSIHLARHEANGTARQLALAYADQAIEAYDVLVALLETEVAISNKDDFDLKRAAQANRRSALSVARHLIGRYDKTFRTDSGIGTACSDHHGSSWEADSSGYSHTTSSTTSTNSSCQLDPTSASHGSTNTNVSDFVHKSEEMRLREHICQLKTIRATIQGTVVDLEPLHNHVHATSTNINSTGLNSNQDQIENAVIKQELMASKEEIADLKAKIYVSDKEKTGLELTLQERRAMETMLRTHVHHLQEQVNSVSNSSHGKINQSKTEDLLRQRIENLLDTLDNVVQTSDARHKESKELTDDLKKANSTLSEALDKTKRKYQSKIKRLEQQAATQ